MTEQLRPAEPHQLALHGAQPQRRQGRVHVAAPRARRQNGHVAGHAEGGPPTVARDLDASPAAALDPRHAASRDQAPAESRDRRPRVPQTARAGRPGDPPSTCSPATTRPDTCGSRASTSCRRQPRRGEPLRALHRDEALEIPVLVPVERDPERPVRPVPAGLAGQAPRSRRRTPDSGGGYPAPASTSVRSARSASEVGASMPAAARVATPAMSSRSRTSTWRPRRASSYATDEADDAPSDDDHLAPGRQSAHAAARSEPRVDGHAKLAGRRRRVGLTHDRRDDGHAVGARPPADPRPDRHVTLPIAITGFGTASTIARNPSSPSGGAGFALERVPKTGPTPR